MDVGALQIMCFIFLSHMPHSLLIKKKSDLMPNSFWKLEPIISLICIKDLGIRSASSLSCYLWSSYYSWKCSQIPKASCILAQIKCLKISSGKCIIHFLFFKVPAFPSHMARYLGSNSHSTKVSSCKTLQESKRMVKATMPQNSQWVEKWS